MLKRTESIYRSYFLDECMKIIRTYVRQKGTLVKFLPGEIELKAMTLQCQKGLTNSHYRYKADGIIISDKDFDLEILLIEVSNAFNSTGNTKISFDHHKAMFGMLTMIRTIAFKYNKASPDTLKKLKIHFLHAHGT